MVTVSVYFMGGGFNFSRVGINIHAENGFKTLLLKASVPDAENLSYLLMMGITRGIRMVTVSFSVY